MNPRVRFFGPLRRNSGYGNAVRNFAKAFSSSNIDTKFCFSKREESNNSKFMSELNNYSGSCNIDFYLHPPPWSKHKSDNYKIAYFYWEADTLPSYWIKGLNSVDEIWAPCELVRSACRKAGFSKPIHIVPTPTDYVDGSSKVYIPSGVDKNLYLGDNIFKFYSIFQWHHRKGPEILLRSYWDEFQAGDDVVLILKVNPLKSDLKEHIKNDIYNIKKSIKGRKYFAPVFVCPDIISSDKINGLHESCNAYVSPHRGEGWGIPIHDAMCAGNNIVVTKFGGVTDFLSRDSANIISHSLVPVSNMEWSPHVYNNRQKWANPSRVSLSKNMREVYSKYNSSLMIKKRRSARKIGSRMRISGVSKSIEALLADGRR